jgi:hypothetical protein
MSEITRKWFVYALLDEDGDIFYIGGTRDLGRRLREHVKALRFRPNYVVLETGVEGSWRDPEHCWLEHYRALGARLINRTVGRNGGEVLSDETRAKLSAAKRGHPVSAETRAKSADAQRGMPRNWTSEGRARIEASQFQPGHDRFNRQQQSAAARQFWDNLRGDERDAFLKRRGQASGATRRGRKLSPETRAKMSNAKRGRQKSVSHVEAIRRGQQRRRARERGETT